MLKITDAALAQIKGSMSDETRGMALRVAASRGQDESIQYGMGFDDNKDENDAIVELDGLEVRIGASSRELLTGATIDYVQMDDNNMHFIFINPNDPSHKAPESN